MILATKRAAPSIIGKGTNMPYLTTTTKCICGSACMLAVAPIFAAPLHTISIYADGRDELRIANGSLAVEHLSWMRPTDLVVDGNLTPLVWNGDASAPIPVPISGDYWVKKTLGRDGGYAVQRDDGFALAVADNPNGQDTYEFQLFDAPAAETVDWMRVRGAGATPGLMDFAGIAGYSPQLPGSVTTFQLTIDGTDDLMFVDNALVIRHVSWSHPVSLQINGVPQTLSFNGELSDPIPVAMPERFQFLQTGGRTTLYPVQTAVGLLIGADDELLGEDVYTWQVIAVPAQQVVRVDVTGPDSVPEDFHATYTATATYDDDSTQDVSDLAAWEVNPPSAGTFADPGVLITNTIPGCGLAATVSATYEGVTGQLETAVLATGDAGSALRFGGVDDYVQVPSSDSLNMDTQATIELWLRADVPPSGQYGDWLLYKQSSYAVAQNSPTGVSATFLVETPGGPRQLTVGGLFDTTSPWTHVALTLDLLAPYARIYFNGQLYGEAVMFGDGTPIPPDGIHHTGDPLLIGGLMPNNMVDGAIDEVRIWNVSRSGQEIRDGLFRRLTGNEPGLVGYWRFDERAGQIILDSSPYLNHGVLGSGAGTDGSDPVWIGSNAPLIPRLVGDADGNRVVDLTDLGILLGHYGQSPAQPEEGDINGDGEVDLTDLGLLLRNYGDTCP